MFEKPPKRPGRRLLRTKINRAAAAKRAVDLFNAGDYWEAHEALELIWRSIPDESEAAVIQGLIQAAAALLHGERGNQHGVTVVGEAALEKLAGTQLPAIEFETVAFRRDLERALKHGDMPPKLQLR